MRDQAAEEPVVENLARTEVLALNTTSAPLDASRPASHKEDISKGNVSIEKEKKRKSQKEKEIEKNNMVVWSDAAETTANWRSRPDLVSVLLPFTAV